MQFAFSNHARNDCSLEWQGVNKQELETGLCFSWKACSRLLKWQPSVQETGNQKQAWMVLLVGALTWFLVCCCALSLLLGCRGVSLGMGPIGVGYGKRKGNSETKTSLQIKKKKQKKNTDTHVRTMTCVQVPLIPPSSTLQRYYISFPFNILYLCTVGCHDDCELYGSCKYV